MASTTIQNILKDAAQKNIFADKSRDSLDWFMKKAKKETSMTGSKLIRDYDKKDYRLTSQLGDGFMYMYFYDPKHKETLPYYDRFPCIFLVDMAPRGFYGLNLHYLPYKERAILMDALLDLQNNASLDKNKKLKISYGLLKNASKYRAFKPCFKRYLSRHVRSRLIKVPADEWVIAAFLPVHDFEKKTATQVWKESRKKY